MKVASWLTTIRDDALGVVSAADLRSAETAVEELVPLAERAQREGIETVLADAPALVIVVLDEFAFNPQRVSIQKGTTVVWINQEPEVHTVTADDEKFDSGDLDRGAVFSFAFQEGGRFPYYCIFHGDRGGVDMAGTIVVE